MSDEEKTPEDKLNALLKSWEDKKDDPAMKDLVTRLDKLEGENKELRADRDKAREADAYAEDITPVIKVLKGDTPASDRLAEGWLNEEANRDKKLQKLWG